MSSQPSWQSAGYNVAEMRRLAKRALPRPVFDFADGGAEDEVTLRRNEAAYGQHVLVVTDRHNQANRCSAYSGQLHWLNKHLSRG